MSSFLQQRKKVHQSVVQRLSNAVSGFLGFLLIFSTLITVFNWPAYSRILQDIVDPNALAQVNTPFQNEQDRMRVINEQLTSSLPTPQLKSAASDELEFTPADLGELYPDEMRLEVPKLFSGSIPINHVDVNDFSFKDLYSSENKIQEALREGVVHYPYTAYPHQKGNVFITGHSSYYPWDKGRYKDIFALLHKLEKGDQYFITSKGKKYTYQVTEKFEVEPDDVSVLAQPLDKYESTLMTCTPVGTTLRRLIVKAERVE